MANNYPGLNKVLEGSKIGACVDDVTLEEFKKALETIVQENRWKNITEEVRKQFYGRLKTQGVLSSLNCNNLQLIIY